MSFNQKNKTIFMKLYDIFFQVWKENIHDEKWGNTNLRKESQKCDPRGVAYRSSTVPSTFAKMFIVNKFIINKESTIRP